MYRIYASLTSTVHVLSRTVHKYAYYMLIQHVYAYTYTGLLSFLLCGMTSSAIAMSATYPIGRWKRGLYMCVYYVYTTAVYRTYVYTIVRIYNIMYMKCICEVYYSVWHSCVYIRLLHTLHRYTICIYIIHMLNIHTLYYT